MRPSGRMVREYVLATQIENSSVQVRLFFSNASVLLLPSGKNYLTYSVLFKDVYKAIWADSNVWTSYHIACDHDGVTVSPWEDNERRVVFSTPLKAPAFIRKMIGQHLRCCKSVLVQCLLTCLLQTPLYIAVPPLQGSRCWR